jgi:bacterioferritin-associated ferredoxin
MIVCVCNAIREEEIRTAARNGAPCAEIAYRSIDCEVQCGHCLPYADELIAKERSARLGVTSKAA